MLERIDRQKRLVLVTGKGGVGKTTVAAALARALADQGRRVLLTEIGDPDSGHSPVGRFFGVETLGPVPQEVDSHLSLANLWAETGHERFLRTILPAGPLARAAVRSRALRRFLTAAPSFHEMGLYYHLLTLLKARHHDGTPLHELIIIDMPATGHALALTGLVDVLLRLIPGGPINAALREGDGIVRDPRRSATFVVTLPETLPVSESLELIEGLRDSQMPLGGILVNRMPDNPLTPEEEAALAPLLQNGKLLGVRSLRRISESRAAQQRLYESTRLPSAVLPELAHAGDELLRSMVSILSTAESAA